MHGEPKEGSRERTADDGTRGSAVAVQQGLRPLSFVEKAGFSLGDAACNIFFQTWIIFSTIFYTDVFGLAAESVALMFLITKIWDAAVDPVVGLIADRTETRWGKFRPYLLWFALPFGILGVLAFTTPGFGPTGRLVYAYATYTLLMMVYSIVNVPYAALMGVMTPDSHERTVLSSFRFFAVFFATLLVQYSVLGMVARFGHGNAAVGWQRAMTILSALAVVLLLVTFATTRERVRPPKGQQTPLKRDLADLFSNLPWVLIAAATLFQLIYYCMRGGAIAYYFTYFVRDQEVLSFGTVHYASLLSAFLVAGTAATILGVLVASRISRRLGRSLPYASLMGVAGVSTAALDLPPAAAGRPHVRAAGRGLVCHGPGLRAAVGDLHGHRGLRRVEDWAALDGAGDGSVAVCTEGRGGRWGGGAGVDPGGARLRREPGTNGTRARRHSPGHEHLPGRLRHPGDGAHVPVSARQIEDGPSRVGF